MKLLSLLHKLRVSTRARHIYRIRHERLLREHEESFYDAVSQTLNWTHDDVTQLLSLTVSRKLEATRKHARTVKQANRAKQVQRALSGKEERNEKQG